jgi:hypothetical protein
MKNSEGGLTAQGLSSHQKFDAKNGGAKANSTNGRAQQRPTKSAGKGGGRIKGQD